MLAALRSEVRAVVAGPEDELKRASCEQMWPSHGQPSAHTKSGHFTSNLEKQDPWEPGSCLPVRRLRGSPGGDSRAPTCPCLSPPPSLGWSDRCQSSPLCFVFPPASFVLYSW